MSAETEAAAGSGAPGVSPLRRGPRLAAAAVRAAAGLIVAGIAVLAWIVALLPVAESAVAPTPPPVPEPQVAFFALLRDDRPLALNVTEAWQKVPLVVEADDLVRDPTQWNRMNFDDWDLVPEPLRRAGLERMIARYRAVTSGPAVWVTMTPEDWDSVPQPVRAMAFIRIAEYWAKHYGVGADFGLPPREAADTLGALIMVESWFEHRAVHVDSEGNRDLGLPQASDYFRARLEVRHRLGELDFSLGENDYFDPWQSVRAGAVWLDLMIDESRGDLDLAIRAYRRGIQAAQRGEAEEYAANVQRKKNRYIRNLGAPPSWDFLWRRLRWTPGATQTPSSVPDPLPGGTEPRAGEPETASVRAPGLPPIVGGGR